MIYTVIVTFDINEGVSGDYPKVYREFKKIDLDKIYPCGDDSDDELPSTTTMGLIEGDDELDISKDMMKKIKVIFKKLKLKGKVFISVYEEGYEDCQEI